jgi:hypothetical protein
MNKDKTATSPNREMMVQKRKCFDKKSIKISVLCKDFLKNHFQLLSAVIYSNKKTVRRA